MLSAVVLAMSTKNCTLAFQQHKAQTVQSPINCTSDYTIVL